MLYTCAQTRGVVLDVATNYSTEAVLHTVRRLMAKKGTVRLIISDPGSQLSGAAKEMSNWRKGWDFDELVKFGATRSLEWKKITASE